MAGEMEARLKCFYLGARLGDALEDLQERAEDLVEDVAPVPVGDRVRPSDSLLEAWDEVRGILLHTGAGSAECGYDDPEIKTLVANIDPIVQQRMTVTDVHDFRRALDELTILMARREAGERRPAGESAVRHHAVPAGEGDVKSHLEDAERSLRAAAGSSDCGKCRELIEPEAETVRRIRSLYEKAERVAERQGRAAGEVAALHAEGDRILANE